MPTFDYDDYSEWSKQLAKRYDVIELQKVVDECTRLADKYATQCLNAIIATTSMQSQSQRRAHARNNSSSNYEKKRAHQDAIELHLHYPDECKQ